MPPYALPFAVGLLRLPPGTSAADRSRARVELALKAAAAGYAVIETFEIYGDEQQEAAAFGSLEELALQVDAAAVVYAGDVQQQLLHEIADRARMIILAT